MQIITCDLESCGQTTYLVDNIYTLDKGWAEGQDISTAPFYVCPNHVGRYTLTPMASAVISAPAVDHAAPLVDYGEPDG